MSELNFTDQNFEEEVIKSDKLVLVDFFASWCGPCKMQGPIIDELADAVGEKAKIGKLDVDANQKIAQEYDVMSIPTLIFFKGGKEIERLAGLNGRDILMEKIEKLS